MRRVAIVGSLLALAVLAVAQEPDNDTPTNLVDSECYRCHATGGGSFGPPMEAAYQVEVPRLELATDVPEAIEVGVRNVWTALVYDINGTLDLTGTPGLGFAGDREAMHRQDSKPWPTPGGTSRSVTFDLDVPGGATDLRIAVTPEASLIGPDIVLRIWPGDADRADEPLIVVDDTGPGSPEVYRLRGIQAIEEAGLGTWTIEALHEATRAPPGSPLEPVDLDASVWFNRTDDRIQQRISDARLDGQAPGSDQQTTLTWRLVADDALDPAQTIELRVDGTLHYEHPGSVSSYDTWWYSKNQTITIAELARGVAPAPEPAGPVVYDWSGVGEVIGYTSGFLMIVSMLTGGVFGRASRRAFNAVFGSARRRVAFHNFVSYGLTLVAVGHTVLFLAEALFDWTIGLLWGGAALICMMALGVTGALQIPMIRRWSFGAWRGWHLGVAVAALVLTVVHILLDGANFADVPDAIGYRDPLQALVEP